MTKSTEELLDYAYTDSIVVLGIGGYVATSEFSLIFKEIDAVTFAKIMYATDRMMSDFEGTERVNPANIPVTIDKYDFEHSPYFSELVEIFQKHFGTKIARL